jgi:hypothetical protein
MSPAGEVKEAMNGKCRVYLYMDPELPDKGFAEFKSFLCF